MRVILVLDRAMVIIVISLIAKPDIAQLVGVEIAKMVSPAPDDHETINRSDDMPDP